jgi:hypothetical protein
LTVVIINKLVPKRLAKGDQDDCRKKKADNDGGKTIKVGARGTPCGAAVFQRFLSPRSISHLSTTTKQKAGEEKRKVRWNIATCTWNSEGRMRENRPSGLMRGGKQTSLTSEPLNP